MYQSLAALINLIDRSLLGWLLLKLKRVAPEIAVERKHAMSAC